MNNFHLSSTLHDGDYGSESYSFHAFPRSENVTDSEIDLWSEDFNKTYLDTPQQLFISSADDSDTQTIKVRGLYEDAYGSWLVRDITVDLEGNTKKAISTDTDWIRVLCVRNYDSTTHAGKVYIYADDTPTLGVPADNKVQAVSLPETGKCSMSHVTIPSGYIGHLVQFSVTSMKTDSVSFRGKWRQATQDFVTEMETEIYQNNAILPLKVSMPFPEKTDLKITAQNVDSANAVSCSAYMGILLVSTNRGIR